jgi:hypothetical protein
MRYESHFDRLVEEEVRKNAKRLANSNGKSNRQAAPETTYEAALYELRTKGLAQLANPSCLRRLGNLSTDQVTELIAALVRLKPSYHAITDELISKLGDFK